MSEIDKNGNEPAEADKMVTPGTTTECAPGCACNNQTGTGISKFKIAICMVVVVAVAGILIFKTTNAKQNAGSTGFSSSLAGTGAVTNSSGQQGGSGAALSAIADLNKVADKLDTVFLVIPNKDNAPVSKETGTVLASVEQTLNKKGLSTGVYTLKPTSPDYPDVAAKVTPPGIAVLSKGRGIGFVSGGMSETKLMQAYVASTSGGGCGPSGCPPPGGGKAAVPCN